MYITPRQLQSSKRIAWLLSQAPKIWTRTTQQRVAKERVRDPHRRKELEKEGQGFSVVGYQCDQSKVLGGGNMRRCCNRKLFEMVIATRCFTVTITRHEILERNMNHLLIRGHLLESRCLFTSEKNPQMSLLSS